MEKQITKHRGDLTAEDSRNYNVHILNIVLLPGIGNLGSSDLARKANNLACRFLKRVEGM